MKIQPDSRFFPGSDPLHVDFISGIPPVVYACISQPMPPFTSRLSEWGSERLIKEHPPQLGPESNQFPIGGCSNADGGEGGNVSTCQPHHRPGNNV